MVKDSCGAAECSRFEFKETNDTGGNMLILRMACHLRLTFRRGECRSVRSDVPVRSLESVPSVMSIQV